MYIVLIRDVIFFGHASHLVRLANRGRILLRTPGPVPFGTCICSVLRPFSPELVMFSDFEFRTSLGTSILLGLILKNMKQRYDFCLPE